MKITKLNRLKIFSLTIYMYQNVLVFIIFESLLFIVGDEVGRGVTRG